MSSESAERAFALVSPKGAVEGAMTIAFRSMRSLAGERIFTSNTSGLVDVLITLSPSAFARAVGDRDIRDHRPAGRVLSCSMKTDAVTIRVQED